MAAVPEKASERKPVEEMTREELDAAIAAQPALNFEQKIRLFFRLYTNPRFLSARVRRMYSTAKIAYLDFLLFVYVWVLKAFFAAVRPAYRPYEVIVPSFLILASGVGASVVYDDWTWFARSGSLVVVVAALMHVYDAKAWVEKQKQSIITSLDEFLEKLEKYAGEEEYEEIVGPLRRSAKASHHRIKRYDMERLSVTYKRYEVIAAIVGTVVWGFGDLLGKLL